MALIRDAGWLLAASAGSAPFALAYSVLLARWLDPADNGRVLTVTAAVATVALLGQAGMVSALIDAVRRDSVPAAVAWTRAALWTALSLPIVSSPLLWLSGESATLVALAATTIIALCALQLAQAVARATDRFHVASATSVALSVGKVAALTAVVLGVSPSVAWALGSTLVATAAVAVYASWGLAPAWPGPLSASVRMLRFAGGSFLWTATALLHERLDLLLLAWLTGNPTEVAVYGVALAVAQRIRVVPLALGGAVHPHLAVLAPDEAFAQSKAPLRLAAVWLALTSVSLAVLSPLALPWLWGAPYAAAVPLVWVLLPGVAASAVTVLLGRVYQALDRQAVNVIAQGTSTVLGVAMALYLVPEWGALGAAIASTAASGIGLAVAGFAWLRFR